MEAAEPKTELHHYGDETGHGQNVWYEVAKKPGVNARASARKRGGLQAAAASQNGRGKQNLTGHGLMEFAPDLSTGLSPVDVNVLKVQGT